MTGNQDERKGSVLDRQLCIEALKLLQYVDWQALGCLLKDSIKDNHAVQVWLDAGKLRQIGLLIKEVERIKRDSITLTTRAKSGG